MKGKKKGIIEVVVRMDGKTREVFFLKALPVKRVIQQTKKRAG